MADQDPTRAEPTPPFPEQEQDPPGREAAMEPLADHGQETYVGHGRMKDKVALITGGDSGIGRAVALAFAREGADVVVAYLHNEEEDAQATVKLVEDAGRRAIKVPGDLTSEDACTQLIDEAVSEFGRIDILVNNAAYQMAQPGGIADITTEQFDRVMKTNLYAMFWLSKAAVGHMRPGSTIINTASIQAYQSSPELLDYATTKAGIVAFTKALGAGLAEKGIRVNAVAPGPIWTPLIPATMHEEKVKSFGSDTPLGRAGQPAELAPAYVYFASQESSYTTGEVLGITGGKPVS